MAPHTSTRPTRNTAAPAASATTTITSTPAGTSEHPSAIRVPPSGRLQLRGEATSPQSREPGRRIRWAEDVVNNEGMGKKSSKVCCIYHKPREVGESSSEDSSDSSADDDSDSGNDDGAARPARRRAHNDDHHHDGKECGHGKPSHGDHSDNQSNNKKARKPSPNAYEKQPKPSTTAAKSTGKP